MPQLTSRHWDVSRRAKIGIGLLAAVATTAWMLDLNTLLLPTDASIQSEQARRTQVLDRLRNNRSTHVGVASGMSNSDASLPPSSHAEEGAFDVRPVPDDLKWSPAPFPANTVHFAMPDRAEGYLGLVELADRTGSAQNKILKFVAAKGDSATAYLGPSGTVRMYLPLGIYRVEIETGDAWYPGGLDFDGKGKKHAARTLRVTGSGETIELTPELGPARAMQGVR